MSDSFWQGFWTAAPIILAMWLSHKRQMGSIADNTKKAEEGRTAAVESSKVVVEAAGELKATAKEMDSATKNQAQVASASATIAKSAAKESRANKDEAKDAAMDVKMSAGTTTTAVENLSGDVRQLKEIVNGYMTQRLQEATKYGHAMGVHDAIGKKVEEQGVLLQDHDKRLGSVETTLNRIETKLDTTLASNGDRTQVRGESR